MRETAVREVLEETAVQIVNLRLIDVVDIVTRRHDSTVESHWTLIDFRADWAGGNAVAGSDAADVRWVAMDDLDSYGLWDETLRVIRAGAAMSSPAGPGEDMRS